MKIYYKYICVLRCCTFVCRLNFRIERGIRHGTRDKLMDFYDVDAYGIMNGLIGVGKQSVSLQLDLHIVWLITGGGGVVEVFHVFTATLCCVALSIRYINIYTKSGRLPHAYTTF